MKKIKTMDDLNKCSLCGKFRKNEELVGVGGESDEWWIECVHCCSQADREKYFKDIKPLGKKGTRWAVLYE